MKIENYSRLREFNTELLSDHPLPYWIIDPLNCKIIFSNHAATKVLGYSREAFLLLDFSKLLTAKSTGAFLKKLSSSRTDFHDSFQLLHENGETIISELMLTPFEDYYQVCAIPDLKNINGKDVTASGRQKIEDERKFLAKLVEQTSDVLTAADIDYKPMTWNKAAETIYGLKAEKVIGKDLSEFITVHYTYSNRDAVRKAICDYGEWRGEAWFVRPTDQKTVTLLISFKQLKDDADKLLGHLISATDISEIKAAESKLLESENRFREMADSSPVMIWMTDTENRTTYINKKWIEFTGVNVVGMQDDWEQFIHPSDQKATISAYDEAFDKQGKLTLIYRLRYIDGSYRWVHDVCVPRFLDDGSFVGYIGSVVDIEDQKSKEEQLLYQATILENVSDILITTDLEFNVKTWNEVAEDYYEISEAQALGKNMNALIDFNFGNGNVEEALSELQTNGIWKGEVSIVNSKNETKYFLKTVKYICDEQNNRIGFIAAGRDITERRLASEKLEQSEQFYRTLIADSLDGMILVNPEGNITFSSPSVTNVLGFDVAELVGKSAFEFVHPEDIKWAFESFQKEVVENPAVKFIVVRLLKKSGEWLWCMVRGHNMMHSPDVHSIVIYFHDDSLRKQANDALKESEKRFRNLINDLQIGIILQDGKGETILCNDAFAQIFSATEKELIGKNINNIAIDPIHENGKRFSALERPTYKAIHTKQKAKDVVMGIWRPKSNERIWVLINVDPIINEEGEIIHIICSVKDITSRKKLEEEQMLRQIHHQKELTQASIDGQENERREIGKELHDNIGQQLTTIKLFLDLAKTTADDTTNEMVSMALKGVSDVINEVRAISRSLVPSTLKDLGLIESISELVDSILRTQLLDINFDYLDFDEDSIPENQKLTLFRIVQEQLNNIVKHAEADNVSINLSNISKGLLLEIQDDGNGFDLKKIRKGLGFMNIRNRAELFGGNAEVISQPGKGCLLKVFFPRLVMQPV